MGIAVINSTDSFRANAGRIELPQGVSSSGFAFGQLFGSSAAQSAKNLAPNAIPSTVVGTPIIEAEAAVLTQGVNYYQTQAADTDGCTIMAVASFQPGQGAQIVSSQGNGHGMSLVFNEFAADMYRLLLIRGLTNSPGFVQILGGTTGTAIIVPNTPYFLIGKYSTAENILRLKNMTTGYTVNQAGPATPGFLSGGSFKIGASNNGATANIDAPRVNSAFIFNRNTTDTEDTLMYAFLKAYYTRRGITI